MRVLRSMDFLWLADVYDGAIYKIRETGNGIKIVDSWDLRINHTNVFQKRDITFDGSLEVVFNHNLLNDLVAYRGFMPSRDLRNEFKYNYLRHIFQTAIQLDSPEVFGEVYVQYNTVVDGVVDSSLGGPKIRVEYNNIIFSPEIEYWPSAPIGGLPNNWWGTADLEEIKKHISEEDVEIEPILDRPNGIWFLRGKVIDRATWKPISEAEVKAWAKTIHTAVNGEFFMALPEGKYRVEIHPDGYPSKEVYVQVESAKVQRIEIEL